MSNYSNHPIFSEDDTKRTLFIRNHLPKSIVQDVIRFNEGKSAAELQKILIEQILAWEESGQLESVNGLVNDGYCYADILEIFARETEHTPSAELPTSETVLTYEAFEDFLAYKGISISKNILTGKYAFKGLPSVYGIGNASSLASTIIYAEFKKHSSIYKGVTKDVISGYIDMAAAKSRYNPVLEILNNSVQWDGTDRLTELYDIYSITDDLSKTLLHKWLMQSLALVLYNKESNPFGADGCLVLQGEQGIGKTTLVRILGLNDTNLYKEGHSFNQFDKDTITTQAVCKWIVELGEIESTFRKSDLEMLKAFITKPCDEYRLPYARDNSNNPRRTSFIATCNTDDFLVDTTGNRRFWTIKIESVDLERINKFNALQLWKQIEAELEQYRDNDIAMASCFRLTREEQKMLTRRNESYQKLLPGQAEILDIIEAAESEPDEYRYYKATATQIRDIHPSLSRYSTSQICNALRNPPISFEQLPSRSNGRRYMFPFIRCEALDKAARSDAHLELVK